MPSIRSGPNLDGIHLKIAGPLAESEQLSTDFQALERRAATTQRLVRNTPMAQWVKDLHAHRCQVCSVRLETSAGPYSEAAHIRPLGRPHDGPDEPGNVLFDRGGIFVTDDFRVVDALGGNIQGTLRRHPQHRIDRAHLAYHRNLFPREGA